MMLKNLTNNAKNLAANAKIEDMTQLFKSTVGKQDVKHALSGVMDISKEVSHYREISSQILLETKLFIAIYLFTILSLEWYQSVDVSVNKL